MKYTVNIYEVSTEKDKKLRAFAAVTFGDRFKVTGITIREGRSGNLYVSMPQYPTGEKDEQNKPIYSDVFFPKTTDFSTALRGEILEAYQERMGGKNEVDLTYGEEDFDYYVQVVNNRDLSNTTKAYARLVIGDVFVVNQISVKRSFAGNNFVAMPSQRRMVEGKAEYQDICYPVTKDFHDRLQGDIMSQFEQNREILRSAKEKSR